MIEKDSSSRLLSTRLAKTPTSFLNSCSAEAERAAIDGSFNAGITLGITLGGYP
jgi:hypothetical protein